VKIVGRKIAQYKSDVAAVKEVRWAKGDDESAKDFSMETGTLIITYGQDFL